MSPLWRRRVGLQADPFPKVGTKHGSTGTLLPRILLLAATLSLSCKQIQPIPSPKADQVFFDDFSYADRTAFEANNWQIRDGKGHPGDKRAHWDEDNVSFHPSENGAESFLRMTSYVNGGVDDAGQTQICHMRKYKEGTYAARVFFNTDPVSGPGGDETVQTFYTISPLESPMHLDYSEMDFEYLPNGGWGQEQAMWTTTWETFQHEPWKMDNESNYDLKNYDGWHTLMIHAMDSTVTYFVDGKKFYEASSRVFPEVPMSINFNLWFIPNGLVESEESRAYQEDIDWVYFLKDKALTMDQVEQIVERFRSGEVTYADTVDPGSPALVSECSL